MVDKEALVGEMVCLHHMENLFTIPVSLLKDFMAYNKFNNVTSGFTDIKVTKEDVGKTVLEYLIDVLPRLARLSNYQYRNILQLPEAIISESWLREEKE